MKQTVYLLALVALLSSCDKQADPKSFHLTGGAKLEIPYDGGNAFFGIEANEDDHWTVTTDADWFVITQSFGNGDGSKGYDDAVIMLHADRWIMNSVRSGVVTVAGPNGNFTKSIVQNPKPLPKEMPILKGSISFKGGQATIELPTGYWVSAETDASWLTIVSCKEGELIVKAGPNPVVDQSRTAQVRILLSDGTPLAEVMVVQSSEKIPAPID